jgi:hypothetical protein
MKDGIFVSKGTIVLGRKAECCEREWRRLAVGKDVGWTKKNRRRALVVSEKKR